ncbi:hypothetical protein A5711_25430 [Mycobacterium sp. E2238]|nr:hypothetical protein A5711_25430 [Mycobacterium sp. E2238]
MSRTSSGAASTDSAVANTRSAVVNVTRRRTNAAPPSGSLCSARASTGTKMAVKVASSTSAATRFGSWLATENALDNAAPRMAARSTILPKPVSRLTSVAKAIAHDRDTSAASDSSGRRRSIPAGTGGRGPVGGEPEVRGRRGGCGGRGCCGAACR